MNAPRAMAAYAKPDLRPMFAFDDRAGFVKVLTLRVPWAHSYADMRPGKTDRERRENYRNAAANILQAAPAIRSGGPSA